MLRYFAALAILATPAVLIAQSNAARTAWLQQHAAPVRSLEFADTNYDDLAPIGRAIGARRIVLLGEQGHGDGATFEAKARVVRYLHQRLGFDLLVFESGFYDCRRTWQDARAGLALADSASGCMFELWSNSRQLHPLLSYMDAVKGSTKPLELAGMDFQPSGQRSRFLVDDLRRFLRAQPDTTNVDAPITDFANGFSAATGGGRAANATAADRAALRGGLERAVREISNRPLQDVAALGALGNAEFWRRTVQGFQKFTDLMAAMMEAGPNAMPAPGVMNRRDSVMGENLAWLAKVNASRKIIVWGATSHFVRNRTGIEGDPAPQMIPAGHVAAERLPGQIYTIAFLGTEGEQGTARRGAAAPTSIPLPDSSSLDGLLRGTTLDRAFLDLRNIPRGGEWLSAPLVARPLGYGAMRSVWPNHVDAFFFIRRQTPSTPVVTTTR